MTTVKEVIDAVAGKPFEFPCHDISIIGKDDYADPVFRGPGVVSGDIGGPIAFTVLDQLNRESSTNLALAKFVQESNEPMRFHARGYDGVVWNGAWFRPNVKFYDTGKLTVKGSFDQLSARFPKSPFYPRKNETELIYAERLFLPMTLKAEENTLRSGKVESRSVYWDRHEFDFKGAAISVSEDQDKNTTTVRATHREGFGPPYSEGWLAQAVEFVTARPVRPRITIRHFDEDAQLFIRRAEVNPSSGLPSVIYPLRDDRKAVWEIFAHFLLACESEGSFEPHDLTKISSELVRASTGTVHAFVLSLVTCVESLAVRSKAATELALDKDALDAFKKHVALWTDDDAQKKAVRKKADGLLSMLAKPSSGQVLRKLAEKGVLTSRQVKVWSEIRPKLAHGGVVDYSDQKLWENRDELISAFYRLALHWLRYKGAFSDFSSGSAVLSKLDWTD